MRMAASPHGCTGRHRPTRHTYNNTYDESQDFKEVRPRETRTGFEPLRDDLVDIQIREAITKRLADVNVRVREKRYNKVAATLGILARHRDSGHEARAVSGGPGTPSQRCIIARCFTPGRTGIANATRAWS